MVHPRASSSDGLSLYSLAKLAEGTTHSSPSLRLQPTTQPSSSWTGHPFSAVGSAGLGSAVDSLGLGPVCAQSGSITAEVREVRLTRARLFRAILLGLFVSDSLMGLTELCVCDVETFAQNVRVRKHTVAMIFVRF
eukprot:CAMPEP_0198198990 /NCGR_PEP_ID=MMETSP1445-20131203/2339_1 /TAXON_ID=36898 /ORGANISM="Pyramimonas sp., Strain CCMP2087" /LENGTH=135 /DNA_ID=CAMNT_0043868687 /DNA_START=348 /DNA_END=755 /DNA_ORIENTATION=-